MAVITATDVTGSGELEITVTTLGASDTLTYLPNRNATLVLNNVSGGALTPNIDGAGASATYAAAGIESQDLTAGYTTASLADTEVWVIPLDSISGYLKGVITVTGGSGIEASLLQY